MGQEIDGGAGWRGRCEGIGASAFEISFFFLVLVGGSVSLEAGVFASHVPFS